ncbi:hypothetical protein GUITHDRAFT_153931 [Guillardia theta CCMP2712]|uniref:Uncharacterized protein n=1 Tax=Guillardia theta (strain CCMP2712) TaxID=905079 RepID=L1IY09_GUITC|nr:hypothetical protein GUITHDRAFT_153931 [Guillardia theta CCMP2712]EKX41126.1 hypothetical protein GUITHDRAFT_153931 [Guillardia theta CCMP2712]|eukprot:XP_005828106.1 hypothetical protein GUITHDRAFT_153931 [Guillardia theta CCMP2712]
MRELRSRGIKKIKRSHKKNYLTRGRRLKILYKHDSIVLPADHDVSIQEFLASKHHESALVLVDDGSRFIATPHQKRHLEVILECIAGDFSDLPSSPPPAPIKILVSRAHQAGPCPMLQPEFSIPDSDRRSLLASSAVACASTEEAKCLKDVLIFSLLAAGFSTGAVLISLYVNGGDRLVILLGVLILLLSCMLFFQTQVLSRFLPLGRCHVFSSVPLQHKGKLGRVACQELEVV